MKVSMNSSDLINVDSDTAIQMLDKLSRIKSGRRITPLTRLENIDYAHRDVYDGYNLQIGDTYFMIPPEFIMVNSASTSQSIVTLRQENTQKLKAGYHKRTILIDLVFHGEEQINGYKVEGPEGDYYVDGLRQLLAQFKCTPFLPIMNDFINVTYGIFTVALQSITMSTLPGFPGVMTAQITLQEVNMYPYIEMPDVCYKYMIDWDLFRFYYQRFLTEDHKYKKLQSMSFGENHDRFKISILDDSVFDSKDATRASFLSLINDEKIVKKNEDGTDADSNYTTWVDSSESNVSITSFQCGYSNLLTNIQLSDVSTPTVQFLGGMDTLYNITFETTDYSVVQALEQCQITNDLLTRNNIKLRSVGFVKLESELVEFTGSKFVMIESVTSNTVPGFADLYNVQINCVAYDVAQSEREELHGFRPFDCNHSDCRDNDFSPSYVHSEQAITQTIEGLKTKIMQDNYAEWKIRTTMEVYPDLHLPTYAEVNAFIDKCIAFRKAKGMEPLPYKDYPTNPIGMLHGSNPKNSIKVSTSHSIAYASDVSAKHLEYNIFVDPDFYVFYPCSYFSFEQEAKESGYSFYNYAPVQRTSYTTTTTNIKTPDYGEGSVDESLVEQFIALAKTFIGHTYVWGAEGEISDEKGLCFDCSGFVTYLLKEIGVMPANKGRYVVKNMPGDELFEEVPWSQMRRGDILCNAKLTHVVIYEGDGQVIHAANSNPYPKGGVKESKQYFDTGRCLRPKAFINDTAGTTKSTQTNTTADEVRNILRSYGLSEIAVAGILGNMQAESGVRANNLQQTAEKRLGYSDAEYTKAVNNGTYDNFVNDSAGYGLVQFTYHTLKKDLLDEAKKRGVSIDNVQLQVDILVSQIKSSGVFNQLNKAATVREASNIFLLKYERPANQGQSTQDKRAKYAQEFYDKYKGTSYTQVDTVESDAYTLTKDEFESICRVVMAETQGETSASEKAITQVIYDRLTHPNKKFGGLSNILNSGDQFPAPYQGELNSTVEQNVKDVFCNNKKYWPNYQAWYFLTPEDTNATFKNRDDNYDRLGEVGIHTFWGKESKGSTVKYTISNASGTGSASSNVYKETQSAQHEAKEAKDVARFGRPVLAKSDAFIYDGDWEFWARNDTALSNSQNYLNDGLNIFYTSFCDEYQYSARGRLVRAFPAYLFCILDDQAQWYDGKKLWTNYYVHRSVIDIAVHATNDMPTETATITVTNSYHNLDRAQGGLNSYSIKNDTGYAKWVRDFYQWSGLLIGLGPKLTDKLIKLHQVIYDHAKLREGARVHLRMGYGSDPLSLAPIMNGHVSDVALGDQISVVVTSDGHELIQHVVSSKQKDTNDGWLGLFGLMEDQEASNIVANVMCKRQSWVNYLAGSTFEGSAFSIEHYGLFFHQEAIATIVAAMAVGVISGIATGIWAGGVIGAKIGTAIGTVYPGLGNAIGFAAGFIVGAIIGAGVGALTGMLIDADVQLSDLWDGFAEQYDICKNIYKANYKREHYIYAKPLEVDGETNFVFNQYNMTPWDVFQTCTQQVPEYIVKSTYHQFDSRLYYGLPMWMEKYRYNYFGDTKGDGSGIIYEECKSSTQVHLLDSGVNIIDNQVKVTSKYSPTNVKVMYGRGNSVVSTQTIHSDDSIDFAYQRTNILDTALGQDAFGPDFLYEFLGLHLAEDSAERLGVSNLLYGWQQQYQGQMLLLGSPGIKPHDYLMIYDAYSELYGIATAREVVHSFNVNTGFTTSVTPGMIGFASAQNSGLIQTCQNYLMILNCFSQYIAARRALRNEYEKNATVFAEYEVLREKLQLAVDRRQRLEGAHIVTGSIHKIIGGIGIYRVIRGFQVVDRVKDAVKVFKTAKGVAKGVKGISLGVKGTLAAVKAGTITAAGAPTMGIGSIVMMAVWVCVDILLNEFFTWLELKNVCVLLPLWWNGYPFVSGVKDGENILLVRNQTQPTDENNYNFD